MNQDIENIKVASPRATIQITLPDNLTLEGPVGTTIEDFLAAAEKHQTQPYGSPIMGGIVDGRLRELTYPLRRDSFLRPVLLSSSDGARIYRRSLVMLLTTSIMELWPGARVTVSYAVPDGGFFCQLRNRQPFDANELVTLEQHMRGIVAANEPITRRSVTLEEAISHFAQMGEHDKVRLLEQRDREELTLYNLRGRDDYYFGYMVPTAGYLRYFRLSLANDGFILQFPRRDNPTTLGKITAYQQLTRIFHEADDWLKKTGIEDIGQLNQINRDKRLHELILIAEALHEQRIADIARSIRQQHDAANIRIVLIAGPSSSGKTTFSKRLAIQLLAYGLRPFTLELDNYFVDRDQTPRDAQGNYDFETLQALNLPLFNQHLIHLIKGEEVTLPRFDFISGTSQPGKTVRISHNQIIIIEGIHGLNPDLVPDIPADLIYRVYVSALTQLNIDAHNRIPTTDVRLLRRIVRDARHRGWTATNTLERWESVQRGERNYIFPYQENADSMFNSALVYELAALRPLVEPLLLQVKYGTQPHIEANRLLSFLNWVYPLTPDQEAFIPDTSILREFIGGSNLRDYHP